MEVEEGIRDPRTADELPVWEREGRAPALDEDGRPDPTTDEGVAYMAQQLDDLEG